MIFSDAIHPKECTALDPFRSLPSSQCRELKRESRPFPEFLIRHAGFFLPTGITSCQNSTSKHGHSNGSFVVPPRASSETGLGVGIYAFNRKQPRCVSLRALPSRANVIEIKIFLSFFSLFTIAPLCIHTERGGGGRVGCPLLMLLPPFWKAAEENGKIPSTSMDLCLGMD